MNIKESTIIDIAKVLGSGSLSPKESAVLSILMLHWGKEKINQKYIATHPYWEKYSTGNSNLDTEKREVRKAIRGLRVSHRIPILHSSEGHYLPETVDDVNEFMGRLEREVHKRTSSSLETYQILKDSLGASSTLMDKLNISGVQVVSYR